MEGNGAVKITLLDIYEKLEDLEDAFTGHKVEMHEELGKRPTRMEMMGLFGLAGTISGVFFAALRFL